MITTGIIRQINLHGGSYANNKYKVELNIFQAPGDHNKTNYIYEANCCAIPGQYDSYEPGDVVYVGFLNNDLSLPIILGRIYQGKDGKYRSQITCQNLSANGQVELPKNTKLGDITYEQINSLFNHTPIIYYTHIVKCSIHDNAYIKFKIMNRVNYSYTSELQKFIHEFIRLNSDCSILADIYERPSSEDPFVHKDIAPIKVSLDTEQLSVIFRGQSYVVKDVLEDTVVEI